MNDPFRTSAWERRRLVDPDEPLGHVYVYASEDLNLNRVAYFRLSEQSKHIRDIGSILLMSGDQIDWRYFHFWLGQLGLQPVRDEVQAAVDRLLH